jgi:DNA-directed RNA polymerase specialized sigma subunit
MIEKTPYDEYHMTQQEVADVLGMSRAHVGSVEIRAKQKLKVELEKRGYKLDDLIGGMA